jgi:hypothetical protein
MTDEPRFPGERVRLGEQEYVIPSLSVKQAKELWPDILQINQGLTVETLPQKYELIIKVLHAAFTRNYPNITVDQLNDLVDLGNIKKLQLIVMGQSGFKVPGTEPAAVERTMPVM